MVLFGKRKSDGWHLQIDATAASQHPTSPKFPWAQLQIYTDLYLKKKGKLTPVERDAKLIALIDSHGSRDVAIAACAGSMSSQALKKLLNVEASVAPITYHGLYPYLQSLVAVNFRGQPGIVSDLEAKWARELIPYSSTGPHVAARFLEGVTNVLRDKSLQNLHSMPSFALLTRRALVDFASNLEGFKSQNQWADAQTSVAWLSNILSNPSPPSHERLGPEQLLDSQFPSWRIWASWRPNPARLRLLEGLQSATKAVLPDILALEGPDFLSKRCSSMREALLTYITEIKQPQVRLGSLTIDIKTQTAEEFKTMLNRLGSCLETCCKGGKDSIELLVHLCTNKPVTQEALQILAGVGKLLDPSVTSSVLQIVVNKDALGRKHWDSMNRLLPALENSSGELLRGVLSPYIANGVQNCIAQLQDSVSKALEDGDPSTQDVFTLQRFGKTVKETTCLHILFDSSLRDLLAKWPSEAQMTTLLAIRRELLDEASGTSTSNPLTKDIDRFWEDRLIKPGILDAPSTEFLESLMLIWKTTTDSSRLRLTLLVGRSMGMETKLRSRCLNQIMIIRHEFVENFVAGMEKYEIEPDRACMTLSDLLAKTEDVDVVECWRWILFQFLEQRSSNLLNFALTHVDAKDWLQFSSDLSTIFGDIIPNATLMSPTPLQPAFQVWAQRLADYEPTITHLEKVLVPKGPKRNPPIKCISTPIRCILTGAENCQEDIIRIMDTLKKYKGQAGHYETSMHWTLGYLAGDGSNAKDVSEAIFFLGTAALEALEVYQRLIETYQSTPAAVVEVFLAGWIHDLESDDQKALKALARVLHLAIDEQLSDDKLAAAAAYIEAQVAEVLKEATRLDSLRGGLKARDPKGTASLLASLGIEDCSPLDDEFEDLPSDLVDLIERHGEQEAEMSFPISHLSDLEKAALGVGEASSILVRLILDTAGDLPPGFCIHVGDAATKTLEEHYPWVVFKEAAEPERPSCHGRSTRMTWQLSRILARYLKTKGYTSLQDIHKFVTQQIRDLAHGCAVCGTPHGARQARLRRPIACQTASCSTIWNRACLDVRLTDIRTDPNVVDMLLLGVYGAALTNRNDLLPGCPITLGSTITAILNALPAMSTLRKAKNLSTALRASHSSAEQLLTWVLSSYRGFLASTSGILKIPGMPGCQQFILANAAPDLEAAFASKVGRNGTTKVLFHGTSLDRLPGILTQGLKICSGTALQRTGAAHGHGIYMAEDPITSFSYMPVQASWRNSLYQNHSVLLGCELAGNGNSVTPGIHVIKDAATVMVRYIFLFNSTASAPLAIHITPAMISAFSALRSGAV